MHDLARKTPKLSTQGRMKNKTQSVGKKFIDRYRVRVSLGLKTSYTVLSPKEAHMRSSL